MTFGLWLSLLLLMLVVRPAHAADPCLDCLKAAEDEWRACLQQAISVEDKMACEDRQEEQARRCDQETCRLEREETDKKSQDLPQKAP